MLNIFKTNKGLTVTQKMIIDSVKHFCRDKLKPRVIHDYKNEIIDRSLFKNLGIWVFLVLPFGYNYRRIL